ncbi:ROK family protein [Arthrobacter oryzae]|uniref:ROK family protein n=1 Tax=Arthrobacter oryzae TaxID=409290 RepID=UPI0028633F62|nr:ROK family protein [Arthrobacter oryzae]MDR6507660.1 glucokinase [Arthrobacter oryzae]
MNDSIAVVAVDVGGTDIKGGIVTLSGRMLNITSIPTPKSDNVSAIVSFIQGMQTEATVRGIQLVAAGVVTPGLVDDATGIVAFASNLGWRNLSLAGIVERETGMPAFVSHDVRSAGRAEQALGGAKDAGDLFFLTIGTGIAAAILTDNHPVRGAISAAGELGHIPIVPGGELCTCGQRGCLEVYVSGAGIARRYAARGGQELTTQQIVENLGEDSLADEVWDEGMQALAQGLTIVTLLLDPAQIVIGGGFSRAGKAMLEPLESYLKSSLTWRSAPPISISQIGTNAGTLGAAILALTRSGYPDAARGWTIER